MANRVLLDEANWKRLYDTCRRNAVMRGLSEEDAQDVAQESITRALEHAPEHIVMYARMTGQRLADRMAEGYHTKRGLGAGLVGPTPRTLQYDLEDADSHGTSSPGVVSPFSLRAHGLCTEPDQESQTIAHDFNDQVDQECGGNVVVRLASMGAGDAARVRRHRLRARARRALEEPPPV